MIIYSGACSRRMFRVVEKQRENYDDSTARDLTVTENHPPAFWKSTNRPCTARESLIVPISQRGVAPRTWNPRVSSLNLPSWENYKIGATKRKRTWLSREFHPPNLRTWGNYKIGGTRRPFSSRSKFTTIYGRRTEDFSPILFRNDRTGSTRDAIFIWTESSKHWRYTTRLVEWRLEFIEYLEETSLINCYTFYRNKFQLLWRTVLEKDLGISAPSHGRKFNLYLISSLQLTSNLTECIILDNRETIINTRIYRVRCTWYNFYCAYFYSAQSWLFGVFLGSTYRWLIFTYVV